MMIVMFDGLMDLELPADIIDIKVWARDEYIKKNVDVLRGLMRRRLPLANMLK